MYRLLCSIAIALFCLHPSLAKTFLVSVGIANYPGVTNDLRISDNDASTIAKVYRSAQGAETYQLLNSKATRRNLVTAMHSTFDRAKADDTVILYFSGHGAPGALVCFDGFFTYDNIYKALKSSKATKKIIIIDACYSGKIRSGNQRQSQYNTHDVMFFLSSRTGETSQETKHKNSLFTMYLEQGLRGAADVNLDKSISAIEIYNYVHDRVVQYSKNKQHPVMWGSFDKNMSMIQW